jgi:hypothetical protein
MASYTTSLRLVQPNTGEYSGTWGTQVNTGLTALVDTSVAGTASITMTAANYTLTSNNGATDEARSMFLVLGGTPGASYQVICPAVSKLYFVTNSTGFAQTVKTSAGTGISVPNGARMTLRCDGTNVLEAQTYFGSLTLGTALGVASGGTGAATFTTNNVLLGNGTSAFQAVAPGANGNVLTSNGTTWASTAPTAGVSTISFGSTGLTPNTATSGAVTVAGTLATANGGTGATTLAGANIPVTSAANTFTNTQTFSGSTSALAMVLNDAAEVVTVSATAATGTINYDITTQSVLYYTTNSSGNFTVNLRASSGTTLNTALATGQSVTVVFMVTNGTTAFYNNVVQVDGTTSGVTTRWQGGTAPTAGNASSVDIYSYTVVKTAASTYSVFAALTRFA